MTIKDKLAEQMEIQDMHDGKGKTLAYGFFQGKIDSSMMFFHMAVEPGAYAGYHRHEGNEEILYIVSGKAENFQDGERCTLEPGDAILVKSGQAHAIKNIGDEDLVVLGFGVSPGARGAVSNLPRPEEISDWE